MDSWERNRSNNLLECFENVTSWIYEAVDVVNLDFWKAVRKITRKRLACKIKPHMLQVEGISCSYQHRSGKPTANHTGIIVSFSWEIDSECQSWDRGCLRYINDMDEEEKCNNFKFANNKLLRRTMSLEEHRVSYFFTEGGESLKLAIQENYGGDLWILRNMEVVQVIFEWWNSCKGPNDL